MGQGKKEATQQQQSSAMVRAGCFSLVFFLGFIVAWAYDYYYDDPNSNGWLWLAGVLLMALGFFGAVVVVNNGMILRGCK